MSTISTLVVAAAVDPSQMRTGYTRAEQMTLDFARSVNRIINGTLAGSGGGAAQTGSDVTENLIAGMRAQLDAKMSSLREQMARGIISPKQYQQQGREAAGSFNRGLLQGLDELKGKGLLTDEMRGQIVGQFEEAGALGGRSFAQAMTATVHRHRALIPTLGGLLIGQALSSAGDVANATGGLDKVVEQGKAAEKVLENVAMLASFVLDPIPGLIAAVVGGSAAAIVKIWTNAKEQTAKARQEFMNELVQFARGADLIGVAKMKQTIYSGDPFASLEGQRKGESVEAFNAREQGIEGLTRAIAVLRSQIDQMPPTILVQTRTGRVAQNNPAVETARKQIESLTASLTLLQDELKKVDKVYNDLLTKQSPSSAQRADMMHGFDVNQTKDSVDAMLTSYKTLQQQGVGPTAQAIEKMITAHEHVAALLDRETDKTSENAKKLRDMLANLDAVIGTSARLTTVVPGLTPLIGRGPTADDASTKIADINARLSITTDLRERARLLQSLSDLHANIKQRIVEEGGVLRANLDLIEAQHAAETSMAQNRLLSGAPKGMTEGFAGLQNAVARAQAMREQAAAARAVGASNSGDLEKDANAERQKAITLIRRQLEATDDQTASTKEGRAALKDLLDILDQLGDVTGKNASGFDGMKEAINGVLDAAAGFGNVGRDIRDAATSVEHAIDAFKALQKARAASSASGGANALAMLGSGIGVVGGVLGAIGAVRSLFGESAESQEQKSIMRENNDRLRELKFSIDGMLSSASATRRISANADLLAGDVAGKTGLVEQMKGMVQLLRDANAMGEQFDELKQKAKELGIQLFDDKGHAIVGAFQQLADALRLEQQRMTQFTKSFDDQKTLSDLHNKVFGKTGDAANFDAVRDLLKKFAPALESSIDGIDETTVEGRKKLEEALQRLVLQLEAGAITLEQYGDLEGAKQLADIISMLQDSLDGLSKAADAVTESLLNVPEGYKVNLARYLATQPVDPTSTAASVPNVGGGTPQSFIPSGTGSTGSAPERGAVYIAGDVYVDAHEQEPETMFRAVLKVAKRRAVGKFGDASRWSEVQE